MKKILSLSLALLLLFGCVLTLASCGGKDPIPKLDLKDAAENLEEEGYRVYYYEDEDELDVGEKERFSAYSDDDYISMIEYESEEFAEIEYKYLKKEQKDYIAYLKKEIKILENLLEELENNITSEELDELVGSLQYSKQELKRIEEEYVFGRDGTIVWYGSRHAVEAAK